MAESVCDYHGCGKPLAPDYADSTAGMKFCVDHDAELTAILTAEPFRPGPMMSWYVKAQGGAARAAKRTLYGTDESKWPKP